MKENVELVDPGDFLLWAQYSKIPAVFCNNTLFVRNTSELSASCHKWKSISLDVNTGHEVLATC
jgi:hypothetical protein